MPRWTINELEEQWAHHQKVARRCGPAGDWDEFVDLYTFRASVRSSSCPGGLPMFKAGPFSGLRASAGDVRHQCEATPTWAAVNRWRC